LALFTDCIYCFLLDAGHVSSVGGSLKDVMHLARHKHMSTTQLYVAQNTKAQVELVNMIGKGLR